jgi:hypothetical protein
MPYTTLINNHLEQKQITQEGSFNTLKFTEISNLAHQGPQSHNIYLK